MDDFVCDFERQPGEEIKEYEPLRDAVLTAIPQARALRGDVPLQRKQPGAYSAQVVEAQDEEDEESTSSRKVRLPMTNWRPSTRKQRP